MKKDIKNVSISVDPIAMSFLESFKLLNFDIAFIVIAVGKIAIESISRIV